MRILHIGLPNSVHLARWIETLAGQGWDQHLLSVSTMPPCSELRGVTVHYPGAAAPDGAHPGVTVVGAPSQTPAERIRVLAPDVVHAHGIQIAGYPTLEARAAYDGLFPPWIVSCWGSDIYHFGMQPEHAGPIRQVLGAADCYVADSQRDLRLALAFGLRGEGVQVGSVAGGFDLARLAQYRQPGPTSARRTIMVKGRNVWVYRGLVAMEALARNASLLRGYRVLVYADQEGLMRKAVDRLARAPGVEAELLSHVPYEEILCSHGRARISISLSVSDGTNLSFLEAIAQGSFPIQSERSATIEWARHGESALFVGAEDVDVVAAAIRRALFDDALVDAAAEINGRTVEARLEMSRMRAQMTELYERIAAPSAPQRRGRGEHFTDDLDCSEGQRNGVAFLGSEPVAEGKPIAESEPGGDAERPAPGAPPLVGLSATDTPDARTAAPVEIASAQPRDPRVDPRLPLVTLITPTYNRADLLPETIESILAQDYPNIEYLVLDDGSTDYTQAVLRHYGDAIRWEYHPNMGQPRTVNRGLELAQGEIIGLISSDDPLLPGAITALVEALRADPEVVLVYPDWNVIDEHGKLQTNVQTFEYSYINMLRYHHTYPGPCTLFRRSVVDQIGGYDPTFRYVPDYDFFLRAGLLGPFRRVPRTLATYRAHSGAITSASRGVAMAREHISVIDKLYAREDLPPDARAVEQEAYRNAFYIAAQVCQGNLPPDERFDPVDSLFRRRPDPIPASPPVVELVGDAEQPSPEPTPALPMGMPIPTMPPRLPQRNVAAMVYDRLSVSRVGNLKSAVPIEWRIATRRWLSKAGR